MHRTWILILTCLALLALCGAAMACPSCKDTIANTDSANTPGVSIAFNNSIYLMLGAFLGVLGLVARIMIKAVRGS